MSLGNSRDIDSLLEIFPDQEPSVIADVYRSIVRSGKPDVIGACIELLEQMSKPHTNKPAQDDYQNYMDEDTEKAMQEAFNDVQEMKKKYPKGTDGTPSPPPRSPVITTPSLSAPIASSFPQASPTNQPSVFARPVQQFGFTQIPTQTQEQVYSQQQLNMKNQNWSPPPHLVTPSYTPLQFGSLSANSHPAPFSKLNTQPQPEVAQNTTPTVKPFLTPAQPIAYGAPPQQTNNSPYSNYIVVDQKPSTPTPTSAPSEPVVPVVTQDVPQPQPQTQSTAQTKEHSHRYSMNIPIIGGLFGGRKHKDKEKEKGNEIAVDDKKKSPRTTTTTQETEIPQAPRVSANPPPAPAVDAPVSPSLQPQPTHTQQPQTTQQPIQPTQSTQITQPTSTLMVEDLPEGLLQQISQTKMTANAEAWNTLNRRSHVSADNEFDNLLNKFLPFSDRTNSTVSEVKEPTYQLYKPISSESTKSNNSDEFSDIFNKFYTRSYCDKQNEIIENKSDLSKIQSSFSQDPSTKRASLYNTSSFTNTSNTSTSTASSASIDDEFGALFNRFLPK